MAEDDARADQSPGEAAAEDDALLRRRFWRALKRRRFSWLTVMAALMVGFGGGVAVWTGGFRGPEPQRACVPLLTEGFSNGTFGFLPLHSGRVHLTAQTAEPLGLITFRMIKPGTKPTFPITVNLESPGKAEGFGNLPVSGQYTVSVAGGTSGNWRFTVDQVC